MNSLIPFVWLLLIIANIAWVGGGAFGQNAALIRVLLLAVTVLTVLLCLHFRRRLASVPALVVLVAIFLLLPSVYLTAQSSNLLPFLRRSLSSLLMLLEWQLALVITISSVTTFWTDQNRWVKITVALCLQALFILATLRTPQMLTNIGSAVFQEGLIWQWLMVWAESLTSVALTLFLCQILVRMTRMTLRI